MHEVRSYCPLCISKCGTISSVDDGRLVRVRPDSSHPTAGSFCVKGGQRLSLSIATGDCDLR